VAAAGLLADAVTAVIPATLAGSNAIARKRANERASDGRRFMTPPSLIENALETLVAAWNGLAKAE
jgi:hypothetical protein